MIDAKQIPSEAAEMLRALGINEYTAQVYLAAALSAWPRVAHNPAIERYGVMQRAYLILPLPKRSE